MIEEKGNNLVLTCDICGKTSEKQFSHYGEAMQTRKEMGWTIKRVSGAWKDVCPECQEQRG